VPGYELLLGDHPVAVGVGLREKAVRQRPQGKLSTRCVPLLKHLLVFYLDLKLAHSVN
jgi:hypothetical protein